ncbi:MAG TPA: hypothetical protein VME23_16800 [Terracidiphilus sp.]|nr:hypothetical protein [Terracidiphilus sp.]
MKKIAIPIVLALAFAFAHAQGTTPSINGTWKIHSSIAGNDSDATCTLTQTGSDLSGTCPGAQGAVKLTGKVDGKKLAWSFQTEYNGSPLTMKYEGTLDMGKITGTVTVDPFGVSGDMTAVLSTDTPSNAAPGTGGPATAPAATTSAALAATTSAGDSASLSGKWNIHNSIAGNENDATCTFVQTNSDLSGTCPGPDGDVKFTGKIDGKKASWSYETQYNGSQLTMKYEGTLDSGKLTGSVTVDPYGVSGDFTGTPQK